MSKPDERGVNEALKSFQNFCLDQIVAAWFADAPDPAALTEEMLDKWERMMRSRYSKAARQQSEATGIITTGGSWLDDVLKEAQQRIRRSLAKAIGDAKNILQPVCVRSDHNCQQDSVNCVLELQRSRKVN